MLETDRLIMGMIHAYEKHTHPVSTFLNLGLSIVDSKLTKPIPVSVSKEIAFFSVLICGREIRAVNKQ